MSDKKQYAPSLAATLLRVAWLSILLGISMEILILIAAAGFGKNPQVKAVLADLVQKISWSSMVCAGLAFGTTASKMRTPAMGLAGLAAAPIAFVLAKTFHKSATQALAIASGAAGFPSPLVLALIKGIEYGALGLLLGKLGEKNAPRMGVYAATGLMAGIVFGGITLALTIQQSAQPIPLAGLVSRAINEIIFPVGCSLVLYASTTIGSARTRGS